MCVTIAYKKCGRWQAMTYEEFQRLLGKAGLNIREFADLVKMNKNSVTNYAKQGVVPSHLAVIAALLGDMAEHHLDFRHTLSQVNIESKKPRGASFAQGSQHSS